jgi:hypothetical protein
MDFRLETMSSQEQHCGLTLTLLKWKIWLAPINASRWQMGFNSEFKGLNETSLRTVSEGIGVFFPWFSCGINS